MAPKEIVTEVNCAVIYILFISIQLIAPLDTVKPNGFSVDRYSIQCVGVNHICVSETEKDGMEGGTGPRDWTANCCAKQ